MKTKKQKLLKKKLNEFARQGALVRHKKNNKLGIILRKSSIHKEYYQVFISGKKEEWHTCNIINIYNYLKRNII
jgi:c-di-AMP phosphodiesterase-like protein